MQRVMVGFTIVEMIVVFGILATILGIGYVSFVRIERRTPLTTTVDTLITDLRGQQAKAMTGVMGTGTTATYGIHFDTGDYVLFHGASYNVNDPANSVIPLSANVTFSTITFPNNAIIFAQGSGDVTGYLSSGNTITVTQNLSGESKTITINLYGAVTSVQ